MDDRLQRELHERGERRHETCRFGTLTPALNIAFEDLSETPMVVPLCNWKPPSPCPPNLKRDWGGLVEYARDCAVCECHAEVGC